jgi:hypothetical protein
MKKILKKIMGKMETNVRVSHPGLVEIAMGIGVPMLAVLVLTTMDESLLVQKAEAGSYRRARFGLRSDY